MTIGSDDDLQKLRVIGRSLHEEPGEIPTWYEPGDSWTLISTPRAPTVQFEHTMVATRRGAVILTQPG